jgi:hypothetical protein
MNPVLAGLLGPLVAVLVTWVMVSRTFRRDPARVTNLMLGAFLAKLLFFAAYVIVMIKVLAVEPVAFAVTFTAAFIALYAIEALMLARLFRRGATRGPAAS